MMVGMTTVAIVSPGFMGAGLGWALRAGGARVVATVDGRSARTRRLAEDAGLELLPRLSDVVAAADVVLSVTPPGAALRAAEAVAGCAPSSGRPLVADLNAVSPETMDRVAGALAGFRLADGAISGPPPTARPGARLFLSGPGAADIAALPWDGRIEPVVVGGDIGSASAVKMCTASVYKGLNALVTQALRTAGRYGVLDPAVADLARNGLDRTAGVPSAATKAHRFVDEMREIAATQAGAGLTAHLFEAFAEVYADIAGTELAHGDPETADHGLSAAEVVARLAARS
jgi:3-hydroxyisobutyrate dehydrogenase-like beta-hydroxyacid dehydrogenase